MATKAANTPPLAKKLNKTQLEALRKRDAEIKKLKTKIKKLETDVAIPSVEAEYREVYDLIEKNKECQKLLRELDRFSEKEYVVPTVVNIEFTFALDGGYLEIIDDSRFLSNLADSNKVTRSSEFKKAEAEAIADFNKIAGKVRSFIKEFLVKYNPKVLKINKALIDEIAEVVFNIYS